MTSETIEKRAVAVIGAGPAGLYAANELAAAGMEVALINRDIKLGGLAEYGIYHSKHKMKEGLRKQFRKLMEAPNIHYYGNVVVGEHGDLKLEALKEIGFDAVMVTVGAQGTKWLGLPGEDLAGVFHAKDLVYHFNKLPPFGQQEYKIGGRVVLIGLGNVMMDIAHWTVRDLKVDQVTAVARRGPAEVKFTKKEWLNVAKNLDVEAFEKEFAANRPSMEAAGQDIEAARAFILDPIQKALEPVSETKFGFDFLANPVGIVGEGGKVTGLKVEETVLEAREGGGTKPVGTGEFRVIPADTVVFCIGDRVDETFGLPLDKWKEFAKSPAPRFPIEEISYEAYDPETEEAIEGIFLAGWAREASSGLVGTARKDGTNGAKAMLNYLETLPNKASPSEALDTLNVRLKALSKPVVCKENWQQLEEAEKAKAIELGLEEFKFASNEEMLRVMGLDREMAAA